MDMVNNIDSVYANIWGHFIDPLQNIINYLDELTAKHKDKDVIWILKNLKTVYTGIESLGNKLVNYLSSLKYFVKIIQGPSEGEDEYIKWSRSKIETLILDVGSYVLWSRAIMKASDQAKPLKKETKNEE